MKKTVLALVVLALVASACNRGGPNVTLTGKVPTSVEGNVVTIPVTVKGIEVVKANGDSSGKTGHFHVFIDKQPTAPGKTIPKVKNIVHTAETPIKLYGLLPGSHRIRVVFGDGNHKRILGGVRVAGRVEVKGPSVQGSAPATAAKGEDVVVNLKAEGVKIVEPGAEAGDGEGHFHVIVDPKEAPKAGAMEHDEAYMTGADKVAIKDLAAGEHVIWVVLENKDHEAWDPPVMDKLTVTVS